MAGEQKRRAESDVRLEYCYSFLSECTDVNRNDLPTHIHEGGLVPKFNALFQPGGPSSLLLYHQQEDQAEVPPPEQGGKGIRVSPPKTGLGGSSKKKIFATDGSKPLTGVGVYYLRPTPLKPVTDDVYNKELICGVVDGRRTGGALRTIYKTLQSVYIPAILSLCEAGDESDVDESVRTILRKRMIPALRSFCSSLTVLEATQVQNDLILQTEKVFTGYEQIEDLRRIAKTPEKVTILERTIRTWISTVSQIVAESFRLRKELDTQGPQDEVEYWKRRASLLSMLEQKIDGGEMKFTLLTLSIAGSPVVKEWKNLEGRIVYVLNESRDISSYINRISIIAHPLYLEAPPSILKVVNGLVQTVLLIQSSSMFYNTSEKLSHLLVKITNQMIHVCRTYIVGPPCKKLTVWNQPRSKVQDRMLHCIQLNKTYRKRFKFHYDRTRRLRAEGFIISEHYIFGKFDSFVERLKKILRVFETLDGYETLFRTHVCGLLWDDLIDEKEKEFVLSVKALTGKPYDYLNYRDEAFEGDFTDFMAKTEELRGALSKMVEKGYQSIWESPQAIKFLKRIEEVNKYVDITTVEDKYERIANYFTNQIRNTRSLFRKKKGRDNIPRGLPPIAGKIMWIRAMILRLEAFTKEFAAHQQLNKLPQYKGLVREYNSFALEVATYEIRFLKGWQNECKLTTVEEPLRANLLTYQGNERPYVNLSPVVESAMAEGDALAKLSAELPLPTKVILLKTIHFRAVSDKLEMLLDRFSHTVARVKKEVRPLLFSQILRLAALFQPTTTELNWTSSTWEGYFKACLGSIEEFNTLISQVHDIFEYQIKGTLEEMEGIILCAKFTNLPWSLDDFLDRNYKTVRETSVVLNEKSLHVRDLVDEIIGLISKFNHRIGREVITQFELEKHLPFIAEVLDLNSPEISSPEPAASGSRGNSDTGIHLGTNGTGATGYGSPGRTPPDWSIVDHLFQSPHLIFAIIQGKVPKDVKDLTKNASEDVKGYFARQVFDIVVQILKTSLALIRRRFVGAKGTSRKGTSMFYTVTQPWENTTFFQEKPVFILETQLSGSTVTIKPSIDQIQDTITQVGRIIVSAAKGISQWQTLGFFDPHHHNHPVNEKKAGRRALYRSISQDRVGAASKPYNYFSQVCENKEIAKFTASLANCTQIFRDSFTEFMREWESFDFLWSPKRYVAVKEFSAQNHSWVEYEERLMECQESEERLQSLPDSYDFGAIRITAGKLKTSLALESRELTLKYGTALKNKYKREMEFVVLLMQDYQRKLEAKIVEIEDVRIVMEHLKKFREIEIDLDLRIPPIEEAFYVVAKYKIPVLGDELEDADSLRYMYSRLQDTSNTTSETIWKLCPTFKTQLQENVKTFKVDCEVFCQDYYEDGPMKQSLSPREASDRLAMFQNRFEGLWRKQVEYASGQSLFGMPPGENENIGAIKKELNLLQKLYRLYNDVIDRVSSYYDILWRVVNVEEINNELLEFQNRCRKLPKGLKEWPAFFTLKKTIDDFNDLCPLLELMSNKSMKPRHWGKIMETTKYEFDIERDTLCLKDILDAPLLTFKEEIEDICISALKERDIEAKLKQVTNEWSVHELTFIAFKNRGELLLRGDTTAETIAALEDSLMILGSLLSNRYNAPFKKAIQKWVFDLSNTNDVLERWLLVQNMWVYLEAVFVGGDIAKQLPKEAKRFSKIDQSWQRIMARAHETPSVVSCCVGDDTLKQLLPHLHDELEICQKSLSGYLEKKRMLFPRFFFVSDPALLEILGQASDSHTIQAHLLSIFDNIASVRFHDTDYNRMLAINSGEGETIKLEKAVKAEGSVEVWLNQLLTNAKASLHGIIRDSFSRIMEPESSIIEVLEDCPAQVGILALQMIWTRDSETALSQAKVDKKIMSDVNNKFLDLLNQLIDQTTRNLSKIQRTKFETLITIHVHQRDIFDHLCRLNIKSAKDFEWAKQCRLYFSENAERTELYITDVFFTYQNEYLGCTERLVITPLTDRCYITLAQALNLSMGGCSAGPAGTGKTETVKDMGKTLGKYVVVFNCSDQMDYKGLGRIYKGLAQSGSWGCFDEFNRINLPVLSVAAQQIAVVLGARRERKKILLFTDGDLIDLNPEFGIFITMNPGYAGRNELPENLKIQFRTVAMMVPDRQIIIRVKLASCGFLENITLARKFYTLYKLCEEQLTKQVHYDFGLRNILSVLRTLGTVKRGSNPKDAESTIVMRVLRDMNLSKLIDEDEPLFMSLVLDLFPNVVFDKVTYASLEDAIRGQAEEQGLIYHEPWVLKLIQLYETQQVRHGIMTLGPSAAGKTTCIHTLMKALTALGTPHREMRMNPKAISAHQMFGRLDVATNDWSDGIFSALWRKTIRYDKKGPTGNVWLVLDGPVDSVWIENLNSVLDDNKTLTLANGDRLPMSPVCKVVFEPHNIDNASPATVSRCGMVYMSSSGLNYAPIIEAWLRRREQRVASLLRSFIEVSFFKVYDWARQNVAFKMPVLEANVVFQLLGILEGMLPKEPEPEKIEEPSTTEALLDAQAQTRASPERRLLGDTELAKIYTFSLAWSVGSFLETEDRIKLDAFLRDSGNNLNLSLPKDTSKTIFDYVTDSDEWILWEGRVGESLLPENYVNEFSSIMVPNVDTVRTNFLINLVAKQKRAVLLIGEQGSSKTLMIETYTKNNYDPEAHLTRTINFSFATGPSQFQKTMESFLEKRVGTTFGPSGGRKMTIFIDDINLPEINTWGDQVTNEIVRQTIEMKGFYSLEKPGEFTNIVDVQFLAAMIQPGAGRNDIPSRFKRHFAIFNCTVPTQASIEKIYGSIGACHYSPKRGFSDKVRDMIQRLVGLSRLLWESTRQTLLPTPAKFHYIFNLRDLSRIWQGMIGTLSTVIDSEKAAVKLWIHEATRVLTDRFTDPEDKVWFDGEVERLAEEHLGKAYLKTVKSVPLFVDFMRDAPEPTGEEGEDADVELPKVYEPIEDMEMLKERLIMFLGQYNEIVRGSPMNLVFFPDAMVNLVKVARIIRNPGGNALLVGVGGSGKQSLTKLASFIAGYKTFQITLTRSYNLSNFLEDLKLLYRTCGAQGKGSTFIFSDQDIKEEVFLEYLNNVLSSGLICNLFNRDENSEIIAELTPIMKREMPKKHPTPENVLNYFIQRMKAHLHVVLCFSPVGEKFRNRALKFPALISGTTINWFTPWPKDALIAVAQYFLSEFPIEAKPEVKENVIYVLGSVQDAVASVCVEYFQRMRRSAHVTPKSYLNFLASYKSIYNLKMTELKDSAERMSTGLLKLKEAAASVESLKKDLAKMEAELQLASKEAERVLKSVKARAEEAEGIRNRVQASKEIAEKLVLEIEAERAIAEEKLEAAKPALEEAEAALNTIQPTHIATVRKLGRPPHLIMRIMDCVLILFQKRLHLTFPDASCPASPKPSWAEALKFMSSTGFLMMLQNYPKDVINEEIVELLEPYFRMEDYNMDDAKRVCGDVAGLLSWTKAMSFFFGVNKEVLPLKANLALQQGRLKSAVGDLARLETELNDKEAELGLVKSEYDAALDKTVQLTDAANACRRKMSTAMSLIDGLSGEKQRWGDQSKELRERMGRLVGDVLLSASFLSYSGPFNQEYRCVLAKSWNELVVQYAIPKTASFSVLSLMADSAEVSEWTLQGLPNDELSIENAVIVTSGACYPLLVDPQSQGKAWVKAKEAHNNLLVTSLNHKYFRTHLEDSLSLGRPLLIEDVGEELDPVLDNVLEKNFIKSGSIAKVIVGDKECDIMAGFMLYITTKLGNPFYTPEISAKTSIIDFTVTMKGLEDQLLGRVILMEKSELEAERLALFESVMQNKRSMKGLEDSLLLKLSTSQGSLVDDEELIRVLHETKTTAEEVKVKLKVSEETEGKITLARDEFRPIASRGSVLYFLVVEMANVNVMYQTSLKQFLTLFDNSIKLSMKSPSTEERIRNVLGRLNWEVWQFVQRSLFVENRFLFTLLMVLKIQLHERKITHEEFMALIKGGASLDLSAVRPKPFKWISDVSWLNLVELSKLSRFSEILDNVGENEIVWKVWHDLEKPETARVPSGYGDLDTFRKLLLVRSWVPDRTLLMAKNYVMDTLGPEFGESKILDLEQVWKESDCCTPLICILSIGSDPTNEIDNLAKANGFMIKVVSMGQGQEALARQLISEAVVTGSSWLLLQNCHLCLPFCAEITDFIGGESAQVHPDFRLWLTTEPHREFPIGLLHASIKFTNEPPQGIKPSMRRTYQSVSQDFLEYTASKYWPVLLYSVSFLHTVVQERRKFGALGWNCAYEFNKADFSASIQFIQNFLEEMDPKKQSLSWPTICYMLGEVQYGGRVTDDFDKRLLNTFTTTYFNESLLSGQFEYFKGYRAPMTRNLFIVGEIINNLPNVDSPEVFGLHPNADITYQINGVKKIFDAILGVQPKQSGGSAGGESREMVVYKMAEDMLRKLPPDYVSFEVKDALNRLGALLPMNIFLRQELDRMSRVLKKVRSTLSQLKLATEGTIIMSSGLRDALDSMYDARVPDAWGKISWDSGSIGFWFTELLERHAQFKVWLAHGRPRVFWMTGFFNPQGFLTAMRQEVTRAQRTKGWALDSVVLQNVVTRFWKEEITESPSEGVYVHGLFVEGASVEKKTGKLIESKPKILYEPVPVIFIFAVNTTLGKDPRLYECPVYRKPKRTDANYIGSIDFQTDANPKHWVLRGVALLCDIK